MINNFVILVVVIRLHVHNDLHENLLGVQINTRMIRVFNNQMEGLFFFFFVLGKFQELFAVNAPELLE